MVGSIGGRGVDLLNLNGWILWIMDSGIAWSLGKNWQEQVVTKLLELIEVGKNRQDSELIADSWHDFSIRLVTFQLLSWFSYFLR